ncbi:MAG TPA: hypothetical protein VFE23_10720 [Usitatibacter sp.]|jgi:hypothetical protein|nr:hypothetical protein [Usitatibacter sp.]
MAEYIIVGVVEEPAPREFVAVARAYRDEASVGTVAEASMTGDVCSSRQAAKQDLERVVKSISISLTSRGDIVGCVRT